MSYLKFLKGSSIALLLLLTISLTAQESVPPEGGSCGVPCTSRPNENNGVCKAYPCSNGLQQFVCEESTDPCKTCVR